MKPFLLPLLIFTCGLTYAQVKVYQGKETIPTYQKGIDDPTPIFYTGRGVQGAAGKMYPYPAQSRLGDKLVEITYDLVYLENEYLKVSILPDFGGKLFSAIDKTNGHELFHRNSVIKPDLIGTLGAWISGGIEWCFPHHHRTTTLLPADYFIEEHQDGSATVWVGETEKALRLRGVIGITLRPGRSFIEVDYRLNNTNTVTKNFLFWANVAVTANEDFRTFFPPSAEIAVHHSNRSFTHWPISREVYLGTDYSSGVDLTWWKNHPDPVSFFIWQGKEGFVGGYDYGARAGTVHVGDPYENKTSKLWQFGPGLQGQNARRKLTDDGKAYVELMTGTFSNNQPGYSWMAPHAVKDAKNYWYPIRDIEVVKNATTDASVTLQMRDAKTVFYGFNTTQKFEDAKLLLKYGERALVTKSLDIDPGNPFTDTYSGDEELDEYRLFIQLTDKNGRELVSYRPYKPQHPDLPETQKRIPPVDEIETVEDLYLTGRFVEQFSRPFLDADDYYLAALQKSPDDYRTNLALGMRRVNQWRYEEALGYLQRAADKLKVQYYQPKEGEIFYFRGLALKALGRSEEAYRNFYQATWYYEWSSAGFYQLALMESNSGNLEKALEFARNAYSTNTHDGRIVVLYSALLRKTGQKEEALNAIHQLIAYDPLNFAAQFEKGQILEEDLLPDLQGNMQEVNNNYLDVAVHYLNAGFFDDAIQTLSSIKSSKDPMVHFYLSWLYAKTDRDAEAKAMLSKAGSLSTNYCFPFREESEAILKYAITADPKNQSASYLLGNLLFDNRKAEAITAWEKAADIDPGFPMIWRNLAFAAFHHQNDAEKAIAYLKKALKGDRNQPLWYAELTRYYEASDRDYNECLQMLEQNMEVVKIDVNAPKEMVRLLNLSGQYDKAIQLLQTHHFRTWEGGRIIHSHYVDAYVLRALQKLEAAKYKPAIADLEAALLYPENLEVGKSNSDEREAMVWFYLGTAYDQWGKKEEALQYYEKAAKTNNNRSDLKYYQALSLAKLGNKEEARQLFQELIDRGKVLVEQGAAVSGIGIDEANSTNKTRSNGFYLQALGTKGLGQAVEAKRLLGEALAAYGNNLWAEVIRD